MQGFHWGRGGGGRGSLVAILIVPLSIWVHEMICSNRKNKKKLGIFDFFFWILRPSPVAPPLVAPLNIPIRVEHNGHFKVTSDEDQGPRLVTGSNLPHIQI